MSILHNLTLSKALNLLEKGEITAVNLTEHYLKKIQNSEKLNAFCLKSSDLAISKAEYCDKIMKSEKKITNHLAKTYKHIRPDENSLFLIYLGKYMLYSF